MKHEKYIKQVIDSLNGTYEDKERVEKLLKEDIQIEVDKDPFFDPLLEWGTPEVVKDKYVSQGRKKNSFNKSYGVYEYKSSKTLFGLPLVHIHKSKGRSVRVAKGIIAVGDVSIGVVSLGGISLGICSFGGLSIGTLALGGMAIGGLAIGGMALGIISIGGLALGLFEAIGGLGILL